MRPANPAAPRPAAEPRPAPEARPAQHRILPPHRIPRPSRDPPPSNVDRNNRRRPLAQPRHGRPSALIRRSIRTIVSTIRHDRSAREFSTEVDGHRAHLDYTLDRAVMRITHTRVPDPIGNRGIAAELMRAALAAARTEGWTVDPVCSYARPISRSIPMKQPRGISTRCSMKRSTNRFRPAIRRRSAEALSP